MDYRELLLYCSVVIMISNLGMFSEQIARMSPFAKIELTMQLSCFFDNLPPVFFNDILPFCTFKRKVSSSG